MFYNLLPIVLYLVFSVRSSHRVSLCNTHTHTHTHTHRLMCSISRLCFVYQEAGNGNDVTTGNGNDLTKQEADIGLRGLVWMQLGGIGANNADIIPSAKYSNYINKTRLLVQVKSFQISTDELSFLTFHPCHCLWICQIHSAYVILPEVNEIHGTICSLHK